MLKTTVIGAIGSGSVTEAEGHTVVVHDQYGNPLMVAQELADGMTTVTTIMDKDFDKTLRLLGITKLVTNECLQAPAMPRGASRLDPDRIGEFINAAQP